MSDFVKYQHEVMASYGIPPEAVANMDETPIPYSPKAKYTLARKGSKSVLARRLPSEVNVTAALTVTMTGEKLKPFWVRKGIH